MSNTAPTVKTTERPLDYVWTVCLLALTAVVFWPAVRWLATQTFAREQLKQSLYIVLMAGAWIAWEKRLALRLKFELNVAALAWLLASYGFAAAAIVLSAPILILVGLVAATGGLIHGLLGERAFRRTVPLLTVFGLLILCVLVFPILDWPLRQMAGVEAAKFLKAVGLAPQLAVVTGPPVKLLLVTGAQSFLVATECNGFGLITSSLLLGLIRLQYLHARWYRYAILLPLCVAVGFVFNFLRISAIVLLAPSFPAHYSVVHEAAGIVALYTGLGLVWFFTRIRQTNARA